MPKIHVFFSHFCWVSGPAPVADWLVQMIAWQSDDHMLDQCFRSLSAAFLNKPADRWRPHAGTVIKALIALGATSHTLMLTDDMFDDDTAAELSALKL